MKYGLCANMISTTEEHTGYEWIPIIKELGFDYIELPLAQMMDLEADRFNSLIVSRLKENDLPCICCNNFFPASMRLTGPDANHKSAVEYAARAFVRAARIGAQIVVFGSSGARNIPVGFSKRDAEAQLESLLAELSVLAGEYNLSLALESLNSFESNILNHLSECRAMVHRVNLPNVRLLADTYHMCMVSDSFDELAKCPGEILHVHIARPLGRSLPCEGDEVDWEKLFRTLKGINYNGGISIEATVPGMHRIKSIEECLAFIRRC